MTKQKKPRSKKYSPKKSFNLAVGRAVFIAFESELAGGGDRKCVTNIASDHIRDEVIALRRDWVVNIGSICRDDAGDYYVEEREIVGRDKLIEELNDDKLEAMADIASGINTRHFVDRGWIVRPYTERLGRRIKHQTERSLFEVWNDRQRRLITRLESL